MQESDANARTSASVSDTDDEVSIPFPKTRDRPKTAIGITEPRGGWSLTNRDIVEDKVRLCQNDGSLQAGSSYSNCSLAPPNTLQSLPDWLGSFVKRLRLTVNGADFYTYLQRDMLHLAPGSPGGAAAALCMMNFMDRVFRANKSDILAKYFPPAELATWEIWQVQSKSGGMCHTPQVKRQTRRHFHAPHSQFQVFIRYIIWYKKKSLESFYPDAYEALLRKVSRWGYPGGDIHLCYMTLCGT